MEFEIDFRKNSIAWQVQSSGDVWGLAVDMYCVLNEKMKEGDCSQVFPQLFERIKQMSMNAEFLTDRNQNFLNGKISSKNHKVFYNMGMFNLQTLKVNGSREF